MKNKRNKILKQIGILLLIWFNCFTFFAQNTIVIRSDNSWRTTNTLVSGWDTLGFDDSSWGFSTSPSPAACGAQGLGSLTMWSNNANVDVYFRKKLTFNKLPARAWLFCETDDDEDVFVNGIKVINDHTCWTEYTDSVNILPYLQCCDNIIAIHGFDCIVGCHWTLFRAMIDTSGPDPDFIASATAPCINTVISFSTLNSCVSSGYQWTFAGGNPASSTSATPSVIYSTPGSYPVQLTVATPCKTININKIGFITVNSCSVLSASIIKTDVLCNGGKTGSATVTAINGTANYTYSWSNGVSAITNATTNSINGLTAGTYIVTITDGGINISSTTIIISEPAVLSLAANVQNLLCNEDNSGSASVTASGGTGSFTYNWDNGFSGSTNSGLSVGTYVVSVTDASSCTVAGTISITEPPPILPVTSSVNTTCGVANGSVNVIASGGTGSLTYSWSNNITGSTSTNLSAGIYTVTVTDASGCTTVSTISITEPPVITLNASQNSVATCGNANGSAVAAATGGSGNFTYSWNNGTFGSTAGALSAGTYTVTTSDGNSCTKTATVIINNTGGPTINSVSPTNPLCAGGTGSAIATASGGTGTLSYTWSSGSNNPTARPLTAGIYTVTVTDANNCPNISTVTITDPAIIIASAKQNTAAICGNNNGIATATASGGTGVFSYSWSNNAIGITATNLSAGMYTVTITDANGCSKTETTTISNTTGPTINSINPTNPTCSNGTGSATVNASGTGLSYTWSTGNNSFIAGGLSAGIYTVTVQDNNGCSSTDTTSITVPSAISVNAVQQTAAACGNSNGIATATANGGTGTLSYSWNTGSSGQTINTLSAGSYTVIVIDGNTCTKTAIAAIGNSPSPTINNLNGNNLLCKGNNGGSASVLASGGTGTLTYSWSNGTSDVTTITGLSADTYIISVTDASGCIAIGTVSITEPLAITTPTFIPTKASCGNNNGMAIANVSGGTGSLSYSWSNTAKGQTASNLTAGTYTLTVTDNNSCTQTATVSINNSGGPNVTSLIPTNIFCNGSNTGSAQVTVTSGTTPYTYNWSNGVNAQTSNTQSTINNIQSGTYTVTIKDANNCQVITTTTVTEPPAISAATFITTSAACGQSNGSAIAAAAGGSGSLTFSWSNNTTGPTVTGLSAANYMVTITDANSCTKTGTVNIGSTNAGIVTTLVQANVSCNGGANGIATAIINGGTPNFTYSWSNNTSGQITTNLSAATYTVTVTDANSCTNTSVVTITEPTAIKINSTSTDATCANSNGSAIAVATGGNPGYTYSWSNGQTGQTANNLSTGIYTVSLTDNKGCTSTDTTTVNTKTSGILNVIPAQQTISEGSSVLLTVSGGITYTWSPATGLSCANCSNPIAFPASSTTYTITATDINGCTVSAMITIAVKPACVGDESDVYIANVFSPNNDGKNDILYIEGNGLSNIYWTIYDRWGNLLFEAFDQTHGWDGTKNGNAMEAGAYVYYVKATCIKTNTEVKLKGNITILK